MVDCVCLSLVCLFVNFNFPYFQSSALVALRPICWARPSARTVLRTGARISRKYDNEEKMMFIGHGQFLETDGDDPVWKH